ncbi:MAG: hypothetical protein SPI03_01465, partial [Campylobacter sputorum]|uniref:hypothetical protein n=1 Tax=Campylobacter sputorum TaxID=206 RepID=UPI002A91103E
MRFFKSYLRYKIIKSSDNIDAFLQNYPAEKRELLEQFLGEILAISSEKMDLGLLKNLIKEKIDEFKLDVSVKELEAIYMAIASKIHKKIGKILDKKVSFIFDDIDKDALGSMRKGFYWMGKEYNENLQTKLKNLIEKNFNGEISQDEIPKVLKDEFGAIINADENYFRGVSDHISLQAQNVATITQGSKYGVKYYKVLAIMDKKTSEICRSMHGRIIPAGHLENQADKIINAKTMAQKKAAATWQSKAYNGRSDKLASNFGLP